MKEARWADELTYEEFRDLLKTTDAAVVPVGSLEQHGPHAPIGLDSFVAEEIAKRLADRVGCLLMPAIKLANCVLRADTSGWPGTISMSVETMISVYEDLGRELARHGVRRLIFVNGHYNNYWPLGIAANQIWKETGCAVGVLEWFSAAAKEVSEAAPSPPHANETETSLLLINTRKAGLVNLSKAIENKVPGSPFEDERELWALGIADRITYPQDQRYLGVGNWGDPRKSTREIGEKVANKTVDVGVIMFEALKKHSRKVS